MFDLRGRDSPASGERVVAAGLAAGRIAIGTGLWFAPQPTLRALGFGPMSPGALAVARIAGSRDIALGASMLAAIDSRAGLRGPALAAAACDLGDAVAFGVLGLRGGDDVAAGLRGFAAASAATIAGGWLHRRLGQT